MIKVITSHIRIMDIRIGFAIQAPLFNKALSTYKGKPIYPRDFARAIKELQK